MSNGFEVKKTADGFLMEVILDRPERGNALSASMYRGLSESLQTAESDSDVGALLIRSSQQAFCMGGDISNEDGKRDPSYGAAIHEFTELWLSRTIPTIALIDGGAQAYGCALALSADLVFATQNAWFALPELLHGLVPVYALAVLNGSGNSKVGEQLMWRGKRVSAAEVSAYSGNMTSHGTLLDAEASLTSILNGWKGGSVDSLRRAKRFTNNSAMSAREACLSDAQEALRQALRDADEDPGKAQSYLSEDNARK